MKKMMWSSAGTIASTHKCPSKSTLRIICLVLSCNTCILFDFQLVRSALKPDLDMDVCGVIVIDRSCLWFCWMWSNNVNPHLFTRTLVWVWGSTSLTRTTTAAMISWFCVFPLIFMVPTHSTVWGPYCDYSGFSSYSSSVYYLYDFVQQDGGVFTKGAKNFESFLQILYRFEAFLPNHGLVKGLEVTFFSPLILFFFDLILF